MIINTSSKEEIIKSLCDVLNCNKEKIYEIIDNCYNNYQLNKQIFYVDDQYDYFYKFIEENKGNEINNIYLYHLGRRLDDNDEGISLKELLINESSLSMYLKGYGITFKNDKYLKVYVNGNEVNIDDCIYLKQRFGQIYEELDFRGLFFNDKIKDNDLYINCKDGPEFLDYIELVTGIDLIDCYCDSSNYYLYEYKVNINDIYFDNYESLNNYQKQIHIIIKCLQRLYAYKYDDIKYDEDNPVIGVKSKIDSKCLVRKIKL